MAPVTESWNSSGAPAGHQPLFLTSTLMLYPHVGLSDLTRCERYARQADRTFVL